MTLFGTTFDAQQLASLVSLLVMLVFWIMVWKRQRSSDRALNQHLQEKFKRPEGQEDASKGTNPPKTPTGPWG